jgi:release factor glutamine methyltransferase
LPAEVAGWEPPGALYAGADGLDAHRRLAPALGRLLAPGGIACVEIGAGQAGAAGALYAAEKLAVAARADLQGVPRCLVVGR